MATRFIFCQLIFQHYQTAILQMQKSKGQTTQISRVQKIDKTAILQVQKSKGQTARVQKVENRCKKIFAIFAPAIFGFRPFALLPFWVV